MSDDTLSLDSQPGCPPCTTAKEFLSRAGIPSVVKDVTVDPVAIEEMMAVGSRSTTRATLRPSGSGRSRLTAPGSRAWRS